MTRHAPFISRCTCYHVPLPPPAPKPLIFVPRTPTWKDRYRAAAGLEVVIGRFE